MKKRKTIFFVLIQFLVSVILASNPADLANELRFEPVQMDYEEGIRNVVSIYEILEDDRGVFWLGSIKGLYRFNGSSAIDITTRINNSQSNLVASSWITALAKDDTNRIWFGTTLGLYVYDQKTDHCISIALETAKNITSHNAYINAIAFKNNNAYIGTRDGLYQVDLVDLIVKDSYMTNGDRQNDKGTKSTILTINPEISDTELWFASSTGVHRMALATSLLDTFMLESHNEKVKNYFMNGIYHREKIVYADYKYGVVKFDLATGSFENDLVDNTKFSRSKSIVHLEGDLFLINVERKGIAVYDAISKKYHWMETSGNTKASNYNITKDSHGYLMFATNGQLYRSNLSFPQESVSNASSIDIANAFANGKKLNNILGATERLFLNHTENNLQINFSLTNNFLYKNLTFQCHIDSKGWIEIVDKNKLNLFNLPAGKHHLTIRAKEDESVIASSSILIEVYRPFTSSPVFYGLIMLGVLGLAFAVYFYNKRQYEQAAKVKSKYETRLATLESQALRSQINPHFIFNTLNSIKYYSIEKSPEETSDFISSFSTLIRRILENSKKNLITLHEEIETLRNYTDIEALRFHERFDVLYKVDSAIETERFLIPPMIIQPFIENAIWHGLMHKSGDRVLKISFKQNGFGVVCEVIDNGIGREASNALKTNSRHKSSLGMKITEERMEIINARNLTNNSYNIEDLMDEDGTPSGTKVSIYFLPKENH